MQIVHKIDNLNKALGSKSGKITGFVPTMGTLHNGHLSLIRAAGKKSNFIIVSIFVNPTQFNSKEDLESYPFNLEKDIAILKKEKVDLLFIPEYSELYDEETPINTSFNELENVLEGKHRKGHFKGVLRVLNIFFKLLNPNFAFFGEKDYQQYLIVKQFTSLFFKNIEIVLCPTYREENGLAMSSRNSRLDKKHLNQTHKLFEVLLFCKSNFELSKRESLEEICFKKISSFSHPEYFEIRLANDLQNNGSIDQKWRAFTATKFGSVRLIDNIALN
jgi:pantoate--beta-alanine ligase